MIFFNLIKECTKKPYTNLIGTLIIVTVTWEVSLCLKSYYNTIFITNSLNFCVLNCTQRVNYMRESCDTGCECTAYIGINKSHLSSFVIIFIMHILNQVQRIHVQPRQPIHHAVVGSDHLVVVEHLAGDRAIRRAALLAGLESGKVRAAGLDVYADEPATNKALYSHPMVSCTPHIGAATVEAQKRIGAEIVDIISKM